MERQITHPPFPLDVWLLVLQYLAASSMHLYNLDDIHTLPAQRRVLSWDGGERRVKEWLDLRRICHAWYYERPRVPYMVLKDGEEDAGHPKGPISWVHIDGNQSVLNKFKIFIQNDSMMHQIVTLSISATLVPVLHSILTLGKFLPTVQNLSLRCARCRYHGFWTTLQENFPDILFLRVASVESIDDCRTVTFRRLRLLEVSGVMIRYPHRFNLPSLRHLFVEDIPNFPWSSISYPKDLVSILETNTGDLTNAGGLEGVGHLKRNARIKTWAEAQNVRMAAVSVVSCLDVAPRPDHPLEHLVVYLNVDCSKNGYGITGHVLRALRTFTRLKRLSVDTQGLTYWEEMTLRAACMYRGVLWTPLPPLPYPTNHSMLRTGGRIVARWIRYHIA